MRLKNIPTNSILPLQNDISFSNIEYKKSPVKKTHNARLIKLYFVFLFEIVTAGFPDIEFAVAETLVFSFFGFLVSLLLRLLLPFPIEVPSRWQRYFWAAYDPLIS